MKLRRQIVRASLAITLVPAALITAVMAGIMYFQADAIRNHYGIDVGHLEAFDRSVVFTLIFCVFVVLFITSAILARWLTREIDAPVQALMKATQQIRDGNLDYELKPDTNVEEINQLCILFEQMRLKLRETNEANFEFDRQSRELISNISHDLRTPITAVKGYCEGLMDGVADTPEKRERYVRTIYNKANEMDRLINELSFYSRISTNRIPYAFDKMPVRAFFDDFSAEISEDLRTKGFLYTYENTVPEEVRVIADAEQISRVLNNLIGNAVKYSDKRERRIDLRAVMEGDEIRIAVSDNGQGIAQEDIAYIFERFYRTDSSRHSPAGGSGIGLAIVKKIVEDHNGRVWVSSRKGEGTTVSFALRAYEDKQPA